MNGKLIINEITNKPYLVVRGRAPHNEEDIVGFHGYFETWDAAAEVARNMSDGDDLYWWVLDTRTNEPAPATDNPDADVTDADFARWEAELVAKDVHNTVIRLIDRATFCADMPGASDEVRQQMATLIAALTAAKQVADTL